MIKKKVAKPLLVFLGIIIVVLLFLLAKISAEKLVAEGNYQLQIGYYQRALDSYKKASSIWPLIRSNGEFRVSLTRAQARLTEAENTPGVSIYFKNSATTDQINSLMTTIKTINGVREVRYISQDDALAIYKKNIQGDKELLKLISKDILPTSLQVYTVNFSTESLQNRIAAVAGNKSFVDKVIKTPLVSTMK